VKRTQALQEAIDATAAAGFALPIRLARTERRYSMALGSDCWSVEEADRTLIAICGERRYAAVIVESLNCALGAAAWSDVEEQDTVLDRLTRLGLITSDPALGDTCCGLARDDDGRCVHREGHPVYVERRI